MSKGFLKSIDYEDPVVRYRGEKIVSISAKLGLKHDILTAGLATDLFYTLYLPHAVMVEDTGEGGIHYSLIKVVNESEELTKLKQHTIMDSFISTLVTVSVIQYLVELLEESKELLNLKGSNDKERSSALKSIIKESLKNSIQEAEAMKKIERLYASGLQPGVGSEFDLDEDSERILKLSRNVDVSKVLEILSLIPDVVRRSRRKYERFNRGEFDGYDLGDDLERLVPAQLALPPRYLLLNFVESKLLLYDKKISKSLGPLYLLTDKSGSMEGEKIDWAKATAIALMIRSRREIREFYLRFFDSSPHDLIKISRRAGSSEFLDLLKNIARVRSGGGTDITKAILTACDDVINSGLMKRDSDIVVITDGEDTLAVTTLRRKLKQANAKLISVMIQGDNKDLKLISSRYLVINTLDKNSILKVVEA
ncbi:MAG: VWA domain-containing protein [Zestosphaera sp.]